MHRQISWVIAIVLLAGCESGYFPELTHYLEISAHFALL